MPEPRPPRRRNSLRYAGYDYRQAGCYFVTICAYRRQPLFGAVVDDAMQLAPPGELVERCWFEICTGTPGAQPDAFIVMPDHLHGIVMLGIDPLVPLDTALSDLVRRFKIQAQSRYRSAVARGVLSPYDGRLWQRRYHDRIIRSDTELAAIREYIASKPARWQERRSTRTNSDP